MTEKTANSSRSATIYQSLYLANLLLLPGVSFLALLWCFFTKKTNTISQKAHLYRAIQLPVLAGIILAIVPTAVLLLAQDFNAMLMIVIIYFVTFHAGFVLIGMLNLSRAMSEKPPLF